MKGILFAVVLMLVTATMVVSGEKPPPIRPIHPRVQYPRTPVEDKRPGAFKVWIDNTPTDNTSK